jgi:hypothetical protein
VTPEELVGKKFKVQKGTMDERMTRLWAGAEAEAIGYGSLDRKQANALAAEGHVHIDE